MSNESPLPSQVGFSTAFTQIIVVLFTRLIFRIGNSWKHKAKSARGAKKRCVHRIEGS